MNTNNNSYDDLLEITFWQQLNKQLAAHRAQGKPISEEYLDEFQLFCLDNRLFHRITSNPMTETMPLALVTDFNSLRTITHGLTEWRELLEEISGNWVALNLESARCGAFEEMKKLDAKYHLNNNDAEEDDDPELYEIINQFDELCEKFKINYDYTFDQLFQFKASSILKIKLLIDIPIMIDETSLNLDTLKNKDQICKEYIESFCLPAFRQIERFANAVIWLIDGDILNCFDKMKDAYPSNKSVQDFIDNEKLVYTRFSDMVRKYANDLSAKLNSQKLYRIPLLDKNVFAHLEFPFPSV